MGTDSRKEKSEVCLDLDRPSHGRTYPTGSCRLQVTDSANSEEVRSSLTQRCGKTVGSILLLVTNLVNQCRLAASNPSIYYAGQTAGDPLGTTETEALIKQSSGSQPDTGDRWGDYSSMALDGNDSCTFWYTTEYYPATATFSWATWHASLKFPHCRREEQASISANR